MTAPAPEVRRVLALPKAERHEALAELVIAEFRAVLGFPDDVEFPRRTGFFDLGMTSLRLTEIRQRLTRLLGGGLRDETLFEHATVDGLVGYLDEVVGAEPATRPAATSADHPRQLDDLLAQLYGRD